MFHHSTNITQDINQYLINKAVKRMCLQHAKKQAIKQITKQDAINFSSECTKTIVNLYNLKSNSQKKLLGKEDKVITPTCHKKKRQFQYTSSYNTTNTTSPRPDSRVSFKRTEMFSNRPPVSNQTSLCFPLITNEEFDQYQQILRQKKQKMSSLQNFFKKTEKQQKYNHKIQKLPKNPFTTDYNGEKLEIKKISRTANIDCSFIIDVNTKIREQKEQKQKLIHLQTNQSLVKIDFLSKQNQKNPQFKKTVPLDLRKHSNFTLSQSSNRKHQKESLNLQELTLKDFQKYLSTEQKSHKSKFKKHKLNTTNISSIDCIRVI